MTTQNTEIVTDTSALGQIERCLSREFILECLSYDPESGFFTWKKRPVSHFKTQRHCSIFNARYAKRSAGWLDSKGYVKFKINRQTFLAHRVAWLLAFGSWPDDMIDHKDGDPQNNRIANLRRASRSQNNCNATTRKDNTSGVKGVSFDTNSNRWKAYLQLDKKNKHLGLFKTLEAASAAVLEARQRLHGEFANHGK